MSAPVTAAAMREYFLAGEVEWIWRMLLQGRDHLAAIIDERRPGPARRMGGRAGHRRRRPSGTRCWPRSSPTSSRPPTLKRRPGRSVSRWPTPGCPSTPSSAPTGSGAQTSRAIPASRGPTCSARCRAAWDAGTVLAVGDGANGVLKGPAGGVPRHHRAALLVAQMGNVLAALPRSAHPGGQPWPRSTMHRPGFRGGRSGW